MKYWPLWALAAPVRLEGVFLPNVHCAWPEAAQPQMDGPVSKAQVAVALAHVFALLNM
eukprot:COSAG01_NODE_67969_length_265_cov_0.939759_1_plen_58_part_00